LLALPDAVYVAMNLPVPENTYIDVCMYVPAPSSVHNMLPAM